MAGSRLQKIGTIYTRATGLLESGAMKLQDKPLWYDVYEAFPPKHEPRFDRPPVNKEIRQIFYPEDIIRSKFYKKYGSPGIMNLSEMSTRPSLCQRFVEVYQQLQNEGCVAEEQLMTQTELALEEHGIYLDKSRMPTKEATVEGDDNEETQTNRKTQKKVIFESLAQVFKDTKEDTNNKQ